MIPAFFTEGIDDTKHGYARKFTFAFAKDDPALAFSFSGLQNVYYHRIHEAKPPAFP